MAQSDVGVYWTIPDDVVASGVAIFYRNATYPGAWKAAGTFGPAVDETTLKALFVGTKYEIAAALLDSAGAVAAEKDWAIKTITPKGSTDDALPSIANFGCAQNGEYVVATWDDVSKKMPSFSHYEIREGSSWADGLKVGVADSSGILMFRWKTGGATTYRICAFDEYGKRSAESTATVTIVALEHFVDGAEQDEDTGGFTAAKSHTEVSGGNLQYLRWGTTIAGVTDVIDDCDWLISGPVKGTYITGETDLGSVRHVRLELDMDVDTDTDLVARPIADIHVEIAAAQETLDGDAIDLTDQDASIDLRDCKIAQDERAPDVRVFIKHDTTSPVSNDYEPFIPGMYYCRYYRIKVEIWAWDRWRRVRISKLRILERKRNLKDEGIEAVVTSPGPTTISFASAFIDSPSITATSDTAGHIVRVVSCNQTTAELRAYDTDGNEVFTGNLYWVAAGT